MSEEKQVNYRRLPGSGYYTTTTPWVVALMFFFIGIFVLLLYRRRLAYLGPDHVLTIDEEGYQETYRFFNFRDIQAIRMMKTSSYALWIWMFSITCAVNLWIMFSVEDDVLRTILLVIACGLGLALLVHLVRGPTVSVRLETAVSVIELPCLNRLGNAEKAIAEMIGHIESAQGPLEREELGAKVDQLRQDGGRTDTGVPNIGRPAPRAAARPAVYSDYGGRWHRIAFYLLIAEGLVSFATIVMNGMPAIVGGMALYFGAIIFSIIAYSRQSNSRLSSRIQKLTGWILIYLGLSILVGWVESIAMSISNPGLAVQQDMMLEHLASIDPFEEAWFMVHCLVFGIASTFLGLLGQLWLRDPRQESENEAQESPPAVPAQSAAPKPLLAELESPVGAFPEPPEPETEPDSPASTNSPSDTPESPQPDLKPPNV